MKNIKSIEQFLFESKATAKKRFLDRGLISEEIFNTFLEVDITPTKKFIEKMCEFFVAGSSEEDITQTFQKAISLSERNILNFDISLIKSLSELQSLISEKEDYKSRSEKNLSAQQGAEVTYEDDRFLVLYITTEEASKKYGKGTKWCISAEKDCAWVGYYEGDDSRFYFIIDNTPDRDEWGKLSVEFKENGNVLVFDSLDKKYLNGMDIDYILNVLKIPLSAFKYNSDILTSDNLFKMKYGIDINGSYKINSKGEVDVDGEVDLSERNLTEIPIKFGKVSGDFECSKNYLTTLKNCPDLVLGCFFCIGNNLTSLEYSPKSVKYIYDCSYNDLIDLRGASLTVGDIFNCSYNNLISLNGAPKYAGSFWCGGQKNGKVFSVWDVKSVTGIINKRNRDVDIRV